MEAAEAAMRLNLFISKLPFVIMVLVLLLGVGCSDSNEDQAKPPEAAAPCAEGNCDPRDVSPLDLFTSGVGRNSSAFGATSGATVEEVLEQRLNLAEVSPVHLTFRGTANEGSTRCQWRGVARASSQREDAIRFRLDLADADSLPSAAEVDDVSWQNSIG